MASWPPPPPPPPPRPGGEFRNNEGHEGTHNGHGHTMNQTEPQFAAPPLRNQSGGSPTDSFAAMRLDGSSLPPPPARTTQGSTLFPPPPRPPGSDSSGPLAQPPEIPRSAHLPRHQPSTEGLVLHQQRQEDKRRSPHPLHCRGLLYHRHLFPTLIHHLEDLLSHRSCLVLRR
jgi:hypothetical protein